MTPRPSTQNPPRVDIDPHTLEHKPRDFEKTTLHAHMMRRVNRPTLTDDGEMNWLVSYADMMTLLFGFFVIVATLSVPDTSRFKILKEMAASATTRNYKRPEKDFARELRELLKKSKVETQLSIEDVEGGLNLMSPDTPFFDEGTTDLTPPAREFLEKVATVLVQKASKYEVVVEGHTDDIPVLSQKFPSNWELSSARAGSVVRFLEDRGFPHARLRPVGLADTVPLVPNHNFLGKAVPENQAKNRRIVLRIRELAKN